MSIQFIANNRTSQSLLVCAMHTQLVGATCMRIEGKKGYWVMGGW